MKRQIKMKYYKSILFFLALVSVTVSLQSQDYYNRASLSSAAQSRILNLEKSFSTSLLDNAIGSFDLQTLLQEDFVLRDPRGRLNRFKADKIIDRGNGLISWIGKNITTNYFSHYVININNGGINGTIDLDNIQYDLLSLDHSKAILLRNNNFSNLQCGVIDNNPIKRERVRNEDNTRMTGQDCNQRVVIAYTPAAKAASSDIMGRIQAAIDYTNVAYVNSNIDFEIEIAFVYETNYVETGMDVGTCWVDGLGYPDKSEDLCRFHHQGDGFMDEVHDYRDQYKADMCVLFLNNLPPGSGGEAFLPPIINQGEAFCVVLWNNTISTTAHEIGHIQGCHHDYNADPTWTNNHGYVHIGATVEESFKTIMAYNNQCNNNFGTGCRTIPYFSDPNIFFEGVPIGETDPLGVDGAMNAINIMNQKDLIKGFRDYPAINTLPSITFTGESYAFPVASDVLSNAATYAIEDSTSVHFRSENKILLRPGFKSDSAAFFEGRISTACDQPDVQTSNCTHYGYSVDIHGDFAVVGDPTDATWGNQSGAVYIYERIGGAWELKEKIFSPNSLADDRYGHSVAIYDSTIVVGAPGKDGAMPNGGIAYIYGITDTIVTREVLLVNINTTSSEDEFGFSVDIYKNEVVVGSPGDIENGPDSGTFTYYFKSSGTWFIQAEYTLPGGKEGERFGESIGLGRSNLAVGVPGFDSTYQDQGMVAAFRPSTGGGWINTQKLFINNLPANARLGSSVDLGFPRIIAGAPGDNKKGSKSGSAHIFRILGTWSLEESLIPDDLKANDQYGYAVAIDSIEAMVTAPGTGLTSGIAGRSYAYSFINNIPWVSRNTIQQSTPWIGKYGHAISMDDGKAFIGSLGDYPECFLPGYALPIIQNGSGDWNPDGTAIESSLKFKDAIGMRK